jgi:Histidine kinase-, DNA gyrase B-, and HSP90-like ATPase
MGRGEGVLHPPTFRRALLNLVQNARDAMPHGGILTLRGWWTAAQIHLAVDDTGQGIPAEQLPLLFTPFHTTKPEGTGLGLYVSLRLQIDTPTSAGGLRRGGWRARLRVSRFSFHRRLKIKADTHKRVVSQIEMQRSQSERNMVLGDTSVVAVCPTA